MNTDNKKAKQAIEENYDNQGNATHYDQERINTIVLFEQTFGTQAVLSFCEINALKYRLRAGKKKTQSLEQEILKANWYERAAAFYFSKLNTCDEVEGIDQGRGPKKHGLPWEK